MKYLVRIFVAIPIALPIVALNLIVGTHEMTDRLRKLKIHKRIQKWGKYD